MRSFGERPIHHRCGTPFGDIARKYNVNRDTCVCPAGKVILKDRDIGKVYSTPDTKPT